MQISHGMICDAHVHQLTVSVWNWQRLFTKGNQPRRAEFHLIVIIIKRAIRRRRRCRGWRLVKGIHSGAPALETRWQSTMGKNFSLNHQAEKIWLWRHYTSKRASVHTDIEEEAGTESHKPTRNPNGEVKDAIFSWKKIKLGSPRLQFTTTTTERLKSLYCLEESKIKIV